MSEMQPHPAADSVGDHRLTIGVLSITATVLLVGVLVVSMVNNRAMAIGQIDRGGDYIMVTMQFDTNNETVAITDAASKKIVVYALDITNYRLDYWTEFDLKRLETIKPGAGAELRGPRSGTGTGRRY